MAATNVMCHERFRAGPATRLDRTRPGYRLAMAYNCLRFGAPADQVFDVLTDPGRYPRWLVGAKRIRNVEPGWPVPGSRFHHRVGAGPLVIHDHTEVLAIDRPRHLQLSVRASPLVRAVVDFELVADGAETVVCMQEEPAERLVGNLVRPVLDPVTHVRNQRSLQRLAEVVRLDAAGA
ncbi:MAG: SRPBCC domain-containing protein [Actinomycetota bacterium]|nr:SRPBCC domain-containing protein [Actinomycetota bacterium]